MWSFAFPVAEYMLQSWRTVALVLTRQVIAVSALFMAWLYIDGFDRIRPVAMVFGRVGRYRGRLLDLNHCSG